MSKVVQQNTYVDYDEGAHDNRPRGDIILTGMIYLEAKFQDRNWLRREKCQKVFMN